MEEEVGTREGNEVCIMKAEMRPMFGVKRKEKRHPED